MVMERQARVFLLESRAVAIPVDLSVARCHSFAALGAAGVQELHAALYDGEGVEVASDRSPRESALVHVCPQAAENARTAPHYLVLTSVAGSGSVAVSEAESVPGVGEGFEGLFDELVAPTVPFREVEQMLARSRTALRARGLVATGEPVIRALPERGSMRLEVTAEPGRCYLGLARAGGGVEDVDLFLFDARGVEVARDLSRGPEASVEHCTRTDAVSQTHVLEVRVYRGEGAVGLAAFVGPSARADARDAREVDEAIGPARRRADAVAQLELEIASFLEDGFESPLVVARSAVITPGEVLTHDVVLGPGCGIVVAVGSDESMDVDLYLADGNGREVDADTETRSRAVVRACRPTARVMRAAVKVYGRDGTYALAVLRAPRRIVDEPGLRLAELTAEPRARGYRTVLEDRREVVEGTRTGGAVDVPPGRCLVVAVAGAGDLLDVDLELRGANDRVLSADSGPLRHATARWCAGSDVDRAETVRWHAHAYRGSGTLRVVVLEGDAV